MTITANTTVADIASTLPSSVRVFQHHGIDFCCGGKTPLGVACAEQGLAFDEVVGAIEAAAADRAPDDRNWNREPLHVLIDHIVATYHDELRIELPRVQAMAAKVARVHGEKDQNLLHVYEIVRELAADLDAHMRKEETILFPAIAAMERGGDGPAMPIYAPITVMEHEHDRAGELLSQLRTITKGYAAPAWACETFRALYYGLTQLESAMHVHVHLENNVLFPRALALAGLTAK